MIKVSKKWFFENLYKRRDWVSPSTDKFLVLVYCFWMLFYWMNFIVIVFSKLQLINKKWNVMHNYVLIIFCMYCLCYKFQKANNFDWNCQFLVKSWRITICSTSKFTEIKLGSYWRLYFSFYLSNSLYKILSRSKITKNTEKRLVFGKNGSCRLSSFL